ncbi:MAG: hypothetical protein A3C88_02665 [Candidatus Yanofskybacteria bacterium RIFCSPHIGHO2_02_FULL_50_12]|uniref:Uncharacterized protein n=1 Tax=Candidatus Yanofskybacteria bacterium RIFCSPHIGHO2_02_FULL_50_12 TaxID=1802685 RepID=A0A1F8FU53_9BACT|nr:MAG: hypothetical protein A3C88_02665 [Candidatus Yanofskybacteria bacterium RIFCSPHIGHO2_02_FULL_50_12]
MQQFPVHVRYTQEVLRRPRQYHRLHEEIARFGNGPFRVVEAPGRCDCNQRPHRLSCKGSLATIQTKIGTKQEMVDILEPFPDPIQGIGN